MKLFLALAALVGFASASCPNACSGHGTCNSMDHCTCYGETEADDAPKLWRGADCSLMACPRGVSWIAVSTVAGKEDYLHETDVECSGGGTCDTSTGECTCFKGYEGSSCQRTVCPNDCSGHGTCRSNTDFTIDFSEAVLHEQRTSDIEQNALNGATRVIADDLSYYDYFLVTYDAAWDAGMQYGCLCDIGFRGVDCSEVECPTTADAMDKDTCVKYLEWEGWGTYSTNHNTKDGASPSLALSRGNTILIREWNAVEVNRPAPNTLVIPYNPIEEYPCNGASSGDYCSGRGQCDTSSGICNCFPGFTGPACGVVAEIF